MNDAREQSVPSRGELKARHRWKWRGLGTGLALFGAALSLQQNCQQSAEIALLRESNRPQVRLDLEQNTEGRMLVVSARNVGNIPGVPTSDVFVIVTTATREFSFNGLDDGGALDPDDRNLLLSLRPSQEFYDDSPDRHLQRP